MFAFARRPEPQRRPIGAPGISEAEFDRIRARLRDEQPGPGLRRHRIPALKFEGCSTIIARESQGTSP